jgi:hypothetical protein
MVLLVKGSEIILFIWPIYRSMLHTDVTYIIRLATSQAALMKYMPKCYQPTNAFAF